MSFKAIEHDTNRKLVHELLLTFAVSLTVSEIQAVLMRKTTFLPIPLVFDLEFEAHTIGIGYEISHQKTRIMWLPYGDCRSNHAGTVHECDRQMDKFTMTKTALCIASRGKNYGYVKLYKVVYCFVQKIYR